MAVADSYQRKIIHIDMDAFFASVEQRDFPEYRNKPIAVGGGEKRGVVTTASYEARKFGVRSAMPGFKARNLCPGLIFVKPRFDAYREVSLQVRNIFSEYTDLIEPLSLDEAFLDVTVNKYGESIATVIADKIKARVKEVTQLTCSAGVSYCKFLAKVASGMNKPNGLTIISPSMAEDFIGNLEVEKFFGVGKVTASKMHELGIYKGADLKKWSKKYLIRQFGKQGGFFYDIARGIDTRPVVPNRVRKSIGVERTLVDDTAGFEHVWVHLQAISEKLYERLCKANNFGRTLTLKLKTSDFRVVTRSQTLPHFIRSLDEIESIGRDLLSANIDEAGMLRLIGLTASNLEKEETESGESSQLSFEF